MLYFNFQFNIILLTRTVQWIGVCVSWVERQLKYKMYDSGARGAQEVTREQGGRCG